ncbi:S8 family peptidase [Thalassotalea montiporae]
MAPKKSLNKPDDAISKLNFHLPKVTTSNVVKSVSQLSKAASNENGDRLSWAQDIYDVPSAWWQTQGENVTVAVLDTGVDTDHPDLAAGLGKIKDFTGDGIEDVNGHGTHCAGIVGARLNDIGLVGVAPECNLMIGKVLNNHGSGTHEWIAEGIYWAVDEGADIISMSLGGVYMSPDIYRAIQYALFYGKAVICAAGNDGISAYNNINYPAKNGGVITVASHDTYTSTSEFSSHGGELDFMAPGSDIWSTYLDGGYAKLSGTSMATPFVAGLSALIVSKHKQSGQHGTPVENCEGLKNHLMVMASHPHYHDSYSGYGALLPFRYFNA